MVVCPAHILDQTKLMQMFVNVLKLKTKQLIDIVVDGSSNFTKPTRIKKIIKTKYPNEHLELYDSSQTS